MALAMTERWPLCTTRICRRTHVTEATPSNRAAARKLHKKHERLLNFCKIYHTIFFKCERGRECVEYRLA